MSPPSDGRQNRESSLSLINSVYEMTYDPSSFTHFSETISEALEGGLSLGDLSAALSNSAKLSDQMGNVTELELSRDIGILIVGVNSSNYVACTPPSGKEWMGLKFHGVDNSIGWIETAKNERAIAHALKLDNYINLPLHAVLRDGVDSGTISKLVVVHQFSLAEDGLNCLNQIYSLTAAEVRLCKVISEGRSLKDCASKLGVKVSTTRSQLKKIFSKMEVKSQSGLVRLLTQISAASALQEFSRRSQVSSCPSSKNGIISTQTEFMKTRFGSRLAYSKFGHPNGRPVLYFHHGLGCRIHSREMAEAAYKHKLLIYKFDRPGYGHSDTLPEMSIKKLGSVTLDLIDHIGESEVSAIGYGFGGRTLLDTLPNANSQISDVAIYSFRGFLNHSRFTAMNKLNQLAWENPAMAVNFFKVMRRNASHHSIRKNMIRYYRNSQADTLALTDNLFLDAILHENELSSRQDFSGTVFDLTNLSSPLPDFTDPAFKIPIRAIFGTDDQFNNYHDSEPYLRHLPQCQILLSQNDGQLHINHNFDRFLMSAFGSLENCWWLSTALSR